MMNDSNNLEGHSPSFPTNLTPSDNEIIIYQPVSTLTLEVKVENETVWLSQAQMAELFDKDQSVIARHISNIFKEGELEKNSNMQILHNTLSKYKKISEASTIKSPSLT